MSHSHSSLRIALACLMAWLVGAAAAGAAELLIDEDFSRWPDRQWTLPANWEQDGWRLFGAAGGAGSFQVLDRPEGRVLRLLRASAAADSALDRWDDNKRLLVTPGSTLFVRVWARQAANPATLEVTLHEFNHQTYTTGLDNLHAYPLTTSLVPYQFTVPLANTTTEVSLGLRVQGTGALDLQRVEMGLIDPTLTYVSETFANWPTLKLYLPGMWQQNGWRLFGVSGAAGEIDLADTANGPVLRLTWTNQAGDSALDRDLDALRLTVGPGAPLKLKVWARRPSGRANLRVSLSELDAQGNYLGVDNAHVFTLGPDFAPYEFSMRTAAATKRVNPAFRVAGVGMIEISRIEVSRDGPLPPTIELPQGWTPNATPILYWRGPAHQATQVQLAAASDFQTVSRDSGVLTDGRNHWQLPTLQAGAGQFARVRVQDWAGQWSTWSEPTLITYVPQPQADPATLYVYDLSPTRALSPAEAFEQAHLVAAIQGLANRQRPRLFVRWLAADDRWLEQLRRSGRWLEKVQPFHLGATQGYIKKNNAGIEIARLNVIGDTALDRYDAGQHLSAPASTAITLKVWARTLSGTTRLRLGMDEFSGPNPAPVRSLSQVVNLGAAPQLVTLPLTTTAATDAVSPSLRVDGIGTMRIQSIEVVGTTNGQHYLTDDLSAWSTVNHELPGAWVENGWRIFGTTLPTIEMLVNKFPDVCTGVVLYDPNVPATSNVASTIAGVEGLLPIPLRDVSGSLYRRLVTGGPKLPVVVNLAGKFTGAGTIPDIGEPSSGSAKNDAYRWAVKKYLEAGRCQPAMLGNYLDYYWVGHAAQGGDYSNHTMTNHDYFIQHKAFFFDLAVWGDEAPVDDPGQALGTDKATLKRILAAAARQIKPDECIHIGGFVPWPFKYVSPYGAHEGVATEWESVRLFSNYNAYIDGDAPGLSSLSNASLYSLMPKISGYVQPPPPRLEECQSAGWVRPEGQVETRNFYVNYIGDYDSAAWMMTQLPTRWDSWHRGQEALSWAWGPQLMARGMPIFDRYVREATPRDSLWAADNGAGYLNPTQLTAPRSESGLPDGSARWQAHCAKWYRPLGIRHSGFVIDGGAARITPAQEAIYETFSGDGMVTQYSGVSGGAPRLNGSLPIVDNAHGSLDSNPAVAASEVAACAAAGQRRFLPLRSILKETDFYYDLDRALQRDYAALKLTRLDPATFFYLLRHDRGGSNQYRASVLANTLVGTPGVGRPVAGKVIIRNLGWDCWPATGAHAVQVGIELADADQRQNPQLFNLPADVYPGQLVELPYVLTAPATGGPVFLRADLRQDGAWFADQGNLADARDATIDSTPQPESKARHWSVFN